MYTISAIAPVFIVHRLAHRQPILLTDRTRVVLISSEAGSITLRTDAGNNFGHHGSKAALNMVGRLLHLALREKQVIISIVHPGFMRTEKTRKAGLEGVYEVYNGE